MLSLFSIYRIPITLLYYVINTPIFRGTHEKHNVLDLLMEVEQVPVPFCSHEYLMRLRISAQFSICFLKKGTASHFSDLTLTSSL